MKIPRVKTPRLTLWFVISVALAVLAYTTRQHDTLLSITFYKAHLMSLGGWGGYWLDRVLFPYARPHTFLDALAPEVEVDEGVLKAVRSVDDIPQLSMESLDGMGGMGLFCMAALRRAVIVAASLICVGMAA